MTLPYDTKTNLNTIAITCLMLLSFVIAPIVQADALLDQLNAQQADKQKQLDQLNQQIKGYETQVAQTQTKANTLKNQVSIYDNEIASTQLAIQAKQTEIDDGNLQIQEINHLIDQKNQDIADNQTILSQLIVELNQYDDQYALQTTIGSDSLSDFFDQIEYNKSLQDKIDQLTEQIKTLKTQLQNQQKDLQTHVKQLQELQKELQVSQDSLSSQRDQKQQLLDQTKGLEKNFQKLLSSGQQDEANLQKEVNDLDNQIRAKIGNKTLGPAKGVLAWPVDGIVTQGYGNTGFTALGYNFHNGLDIAGPAGTPVYAAADGVIFDTDQSDVEYGNWVAIKHSLTDQNGGALNIITLYGHMRTFIVTKGQTVKQGDIIGYEGNTGNTTKKLYGPEHGYHVHFGVYDVQGFGVNNGAYTKIYGPYRIPYGYTYDPRNFLSAQ